MGGSHLRQEQYATDPDDELIPTAIVIKNIPFAVKKEQLVEIMTHMSLPLPYAFNYHFDNGVFRGLAFANFTSADETAQVIDGLNHFELQGRKLRVEYKKMLPLQERERIEREKRERRGQLEEQHRPMGSSQLHSQPSMSSMSSRVQATSPSPLSARDGKPGKLGTSLGNFGANECLCRTRSERSGNSWLLFRALTLQQGPYPRSIDFPNHRYSGATPYHPHIGPPHGTGAYFERGE